ncbi:vesicle-associated membrane protein 7-like [Liolophura sinensis]|uniref:vesicle-associated membrane protein 7-like n=1 Tax=Liolophura sinensis TaxID=3198878 RepID=UPI00315809AF
MTIKFSCIAHGTTILCSHQIEGNFYDVAASMLPNISSRKDGKTSYTANSYQFHCLVDNGIVYMCVAEPSFGKQQPYAYLAEIKRRFQSGTLASRSFSAGPDEFDRDFGFVLSGQMEKYSKPGGGDHISALRSQVDEVKDVMTQNIDKVLERGERLDDLMDKTEELEANSATFQRTAKRIRRKYWWKNTKMMLILVCVVLVVIVVLVIVILYSTHVLPPNSDTSTTVATTTVSG